MTVAGSDSGGGAGIQADLKTFHQWGVFGTSVVTAVTAQNTTGVFRVDTLDPEAVVAQINAVAEDFEVGAVKSGMLANAGLVEAVAGAIATSELGAFVLDPVMVATSGHRLLDADACDGVRERLLPLADLVTPNWPEATLLTGVSGEGETAQREAARALVELGAGSALVKGGHLPGSEVVDVFWDGERESVFRHQRVNSRHTHGTGCSLSAAITAGLAHGWSLERSAETAIRWLHEAIVTAPGLGNGNGPVNHWAPVPTSDRSG